MFVVIAKLIVELVVGGYLLFDSLLFVNQFDVKITHLDSVVVDYKLYTMQQNDVVVNSVHEYHA